ncbi:MAG: hypothetical protein LQ340_003484 [Diploschistes diacapsis]|nr:MAG: hypothetical protein LQ340_003484 [Diploschistes diacapsis]
MSEAPVKTGEIEFKVPGLADPCRTWYKVFGELSAGDGSKRPPLVVLHGGPGACHEYLLPFADLAAKYSIPCIFYDQIGNGASTHLREKNGDTDFWTPQLFRRELDNLVDHFDLRKGRGFDILGHSWGGCLGSSYAALRPKGLRRLVIANSPASMELWAKSAEQLLDKMPANIAKTIRDCEAKWEFESEEFKEAITAVYKKHLCRVEPYPAPEAEIAEKRLTEDPTVYGTMNGPSEINILGSLRTWSVIDELHKIEVPTLVYNGSEDEAQDVCVEPFFWHIPKVRWITVQDTSHLGHVEKRDQVIKMVGDFLTGG